MPAPDPVQAAQAVQSAAETADALVNGGVAAAGGTGLLAILGGLWVKITRAFDKTFPRVVREFDERLEKQQAVWAERFNAQQEVFMTLIRDLRDDLKVQRSEYLADLKTEREANRNAIATLTAAIDRLNNTIMQQQIAQARNP